MTKGHPLTSYSRPIVLGINQDAPNAHRPLAERLDFLGKNTGNLLFGEALYQVVGNARRASYHYTPKEAESADVAVIAAANWINPHSDFGDFARRLRSFGLPVVLVGIGLQVSASDPGPRVTDGTRQLLDLAAETSAMISVRGERTAQALRDWGYGNVMATGCPSLLLSGGRFATHGARPEPTPANTVLMGTRHLTATASASQNAIYRLAYRTGTDLLLQSELADMYFATDVSRGADVVDAANRALRLSYDEPDIPRIRRYLLEHGKVFFHARDWKSYLLGKEYVIGTRIHGTIAAILSGRRGLLLHHDVRTAELAKVMGIPAAPLEDVGAGGFDRLAELVAAADFDLTRRIFATYFEGFRRFFALNGIPLREPARGFGE